MAGCQPDEVGTFLRADERYMEPTAVTRPLIAAAIRGTYTRAAWIFTTAPEALAPS
jgi:hypothetical protein